MQKVTIWLVLALIAGVIGFAAAAQSKRPRVILNPRLVNALLKQAPATTPDPACTTGSKWQQLRCRYKAYEKDVETVFTEKWKIYGQDPNGLSVTIHYNTTAEEATIVCRKKKCAP
jgi:hypothetical protein